MSFRGDEMAGWTLEEYPQLSEIVSELESAESKFGPFKNAHEGYAVLLEEVEELWDAVRMNQQIASRDAEIRREAIQVAAMALRLLRDVCDGPTTGRR